MTGLSARADFEVLWRDADVTGWAFYGSVLRYFELAEHELMRKAENEYGPTLRNGFGFPRARLECDFLSALKLHDRGTVVARVQSVGRSSIVLGFELRRRNHADVAVRGAVTMVMVDWATGQPVEVPLELRGRLLDFN